MSRNLCCESPMSRATSRLGGPVSRANSRLGEDWTMEDFSRSDAISMALKHQVSDRNVASSSHEHELQKLPLEEIFRWDSIIETP